MTDVQEQTDTTTAQAVRLNVGCGPEKYGPKGDDWHYIDRCFGDEAYPLAYPDGSVDEVYASHILEHFSHKQTADVLADWIRVLKPGGRLRVAVPDHDALNALRDKGSMISLDGKAVSWDALYFGGQEDENDYHKAGFNEEGLGYMMLKAGLVGVRRWTADPECDDCSRWPISLNLEGRKPRAGLFDNGRLAVPTTLVMSTGRTGFQDNVRCMTKVICDLRIKAEIHTGVFWSQLLTRGIEDAIADGSEWIVTMDYDTIFTPNLVENMAVIFDAHPHIDALAPVQMKRDMKSVLFGKHDSPDLLKQVCPVTSAHFGLTFFRASAFAKMPKPWLLDEPDPTGGYGEGRRDADMAFWDKWIQCGNTLAVTPWVTVGHAETMVVWPDGQFNPVYQRLDEYWKSGPPTEARAL